MSWCLDYYLYKYLYFVQGIIDMSFQSNEVCFQLPEWLDSFINQYPSHILSLQERMSFVIEAARVNVVKETGGPFAAAIFESESGKLISLGVNLVTTEKLSILHAEMVAFALAQRKLGSYDLGQLGFPKHELVTSTEPCAMCFGAIHWSGVLRVVTGAQDSDARKIGFDEGAKIIDWRDELEKRGIETLCDINREAAIQVLSEYSIRSGYIYNSRDGEQAKK
jgi:tRNA(Arg) A34 adenosine deaminase TadA